MLQPRERLRFAEEPGLIVAARAVGLFALQHLDRDAAIELGIERRIDHAHAALAELVEDDVAADERAAREVLRPGGRAPARPIGTRWPFALGCFEIVGHGTRPRPMFAQDLGRALAFALD